MKKLFSNAAKVGAGIILGASMTAYASMTLLSNVYLNDEISISVNGQVQILRDATTNEREYPLTYKGRTYIPLRSVATLLGYKVDYIEETKTATVDDKDYVKPTPTPTPTPSNELTIEAIDSSSIPFINQYKWYATPKNTNDYDLVKNCVFLNASQVYSGVGGTNTAIHSQTPFLDSILEMQKKLLANRKAGSFIVSVDDSSVVALRYAYDSEQKLKGCVASYTLVIKYDGKEERVRMKSVFMSEKSGLLKYVGDIVG